MRAATSPWGGAALATCEMGATGADVHSDPRALHSLPRRVRSGDRAQAPAAWLLPGRRVSIAGRPRTATVRRRDARAAVAFERLRANRELIPHPFEERPKRRRPGSRRVQQCERELCCGRIEVAARRDGVVVRPARRGDRQDEEGIGDRPPRLRRGAPHRRSIGLTQRGRLLRPTPGCRHRPRVGRQVGDRAEADEGRGRRAHRTGLLARPERVAAEVTVCRDAGEGVQLSVGDRRALEEL